VRWAGGDRGCALLIQPQGSVATDNNAWGKGSPLRRGVRGKAPLLRSALAVRLSSGLLHRFTSSGIATLLFFRYDSSMSTVQEIEAAIERLPREELFQITDWISSKFGDAWDRQIEEDIKAGRLDDLAQQALAEFRAGKTTPFPSDEE